MSTQDCTIAATKDSVFVLITPTDYLPEQNFVTSNQQLSSHSNQSSIYHNYWCGFKKYRISKICFGPLTIDCIPSPHTGNSSNHTSIINYFVCFICVTLKPNDADWLFFTLHYGNSMSINSSVPRIKLARSAVSVNWFHPLTTNQADLSNRISQTLTFRYKSQLLWVSRMYKPVVKIHIWF